MKGKTILLAGVAGLALTMSGAAYAHPGDSNDPKWNDQASTGPTNADLEARIEALESEVQNSEINQAKDRDALTTATNALTGWWNNTTVSGRMYFDMSNINNKNSGVSNPQNGTHFDIKRFYIGIDHKFDDVWSANITTDFNYDSGPAGATQLYIKKAYLQAKIADAAVVRLGSSDLPWIPFVEDVYGYRYVENTLVDRIKYGTSADWGAHIGGRFGSDVLFEYALSAVNGAGYKKPGIGLGTNRSKGMDFEGRVDVKYAGFIAALGAYDGKLGKDLGAGTTFHDATRWDALIGYVANGVHAGVEYYSERNFDTVTNPLPDKGDGFSVFGAYQFMPEWAVFGRYDTTKPTKNIGFQPAFTNHYYNVGVEYTPVKIVNLSIVYKHDDGRNGAIADSNGTIGGIPSGAYNEIGLFGQLRW